MTNKLDPVMIEQDGASTNDVLSWDGSQWSPAAPSGGGGGGGKIAQVIESTTTASQQNSTSTSLINITGLSASITPSSSSSKVRVTIQFGVIAPHDGATMRVNIERGSTQVWNDSLSFRGTNTAGTGSGDFIQTHHITYIDSPSSTTATTYTAAFARFNGLGTSSVTGECPRTIILEEILA